MFSSSSGGWGTIKLKLTTLPRNFIHVMCRFNSFFFYATRVDLTQLHSQSSWFSGVSFGSRDSDNSASCVPIGGPRYCSGSASCRCTRMREHGHYSIGHMKKPELPGCIGCSRTVVYARYPSGSSLFDSLFAVRRGSLNHF